MACFANFLSLPAVIGEKKYIMLKKNSRQAKRKELKREHYLGMRFIHLIPRYRPSISRHDDYQLKSLLFPHYFVVFTTKPAVQN